MSVYSESFIRTEAEGVNVVYTVPEQIRVVVRCVTICNAGAAGAPVYISVHGLLIVAAVIPASVLSVYGDLRVVAYERETIRVFSGGPGVAVTVSGYAFNETGSGDPPPVESLELGGVQPLPVLPALRP